ncbi:hypothetical protein GOBAR_AA35809 [Gossypium barbadense]|uniref:Heparanase-like protein 2 n=1 Tax=Gossypium barbadense TaxID=3634 RepID=A0A2P5W1E2_GOSBA|nr:hypothetical protein GOBAR_AA35809 [Gossypium barbadense]
MGASVEAEQYGKDIVVLKNLVEELHPDPKTQPKVLGPGGYYDEKWFNSFLKVSGHDVVDGVTHHIYNLGPGIQICLNSVFIEELLEAYLLLVGFKSQSGAWVSEYGRALHGGAKDLSPTFVDGYWYLDQLGMASTYNHKVFCRQTLIDGNYALLNTTTSIPNLDYYCALLWHLLLGSTVLAVTQLSNPNLSVYAHCVKKKTGISIIFINMSKDSSFNVTLSNYEHQSHNLRSTDVAKPNFEFRGSKDREEYHLAALAGNIHGQIVLLNDVPMVPTETLDIPVMEPKLVNASTSISISAHSIVYVTISLCNHQRLSSPCLLAILVSQISLSSMQNVNVVIQGSTSIGETDDNFVCPTLDWWPTEKCNYNQCPWGKAGVLNLDLKKKGLINAIKAFNPLRIKVGGSLQDQVVYRVGGVKNCPNFMKNEDSLFGFSQGCLPMERWDEHNKFFNQTGVKVTFGLNALLERNRSQIEKGLWVGNWQSQNARDLMKYTISRGYKVDSYEFDDPNMITKIQDPSYLNQVAQTYKGVLNFVNRFKSQSGAWVSESGGALQGGAKDLSPSFADGFVLLWHRLMGSTILAVTQESIPNLLLYVHCSKKKPGISIIFLNLSKDSSFNVTLSNYENQSRNLRSTDVVKPNFEFRGSKDREEYHLAALAGNI